ncbi:MAG: hypothetical protein ACI4DK_13220, partial [Lachnospiraceae bacterium]
LRKHRSQILGALLEEFDEKKYAKTLREEGWEAGREAERQEMAEAIARQLNLSVEEVLKMRENSKP